MSKARKITGWALSIVIVLFLIAASAPAKFGMVPEYAKNFPKMGLTGNEPLIVGILEVFCGLVFLIPRTGVIGTILLSAYMGGAIATHMEHDNMPFFACGFEALILITAFIRFPELTSRISGKPD